ncbi:MAG: hypothetical protein D6675_11160 [Gemmatimonadetes bacterium]|nr:MAG: hypothetical protein D6675_11160 [Gemmatimonadota bacterium]
MNHISTDDLIEFIEETLTAERMRVVEEHIKTCAQCQNALAGLKRTFDLLALDEVPELSPVQLGNFVPHIRQKVNTEPVWKAWLPRVIPSVGLVMVFLLVFTVIIRQYPHSLPEPVNIATIPDSIWESYLIDSDVFAGIVLDTETLPNVLTTETWVDTTETDELLDNVIDPTFVQSIDEIEFFDDPFATFNSYFDDLTEPEIKLILQQLNQHG